MQELQASNIEHSRLHTEVSHLRTSVARNQSTEKSRPRDSSRFEGREYFCSSGNLRQWAEIERFSLSLHEAIIETARIQSLWAGAQNTLNSWSYAAQEMSSTGVGSGDTTVMIAIHRRRHLSLFYEMSVASAVSSSSAIGLSPRWMGNLCKEKNIVNLEVQDKYFRSYQPGEYLHKVINRTLVCLSRKKPKE